MYKMFDLIKSVQSMAKKCLAFLMDFVRSTISKTKGYLNCHQSVVRIIIWALFAVSLLAFLVQLDLNRSIKKDKKVEVQRSQAIATVDLLINYAGDYHVDDFDHMKATLIAIKKDFNNQADLIEATKSGSLVNRYILNQNKTTKNKIKQVEDDCDIQITELKKNIPIAMFDRVKIPESMQKADDLSKSNKTFIKLVGLK